MQRGYNDVMKAADDGKDDETANLMAARSYVVAARVKTLTAIHELNELTAKMLKKPTKSNINAT